MHSTESKESTKDKNQKFWHTWNVSDFIGRIWINIKNPMKWLFVWFFVTFPLFFSASFWRNNKPSIIDLIVIFYPYYLILILLISKVSIDNTDADGDK